MSPLKRRRLLGHAASGLLIAVPAGAQATEDPVTLEPIPPDVIRPYGLTIRRQIAEKVVCPRPAGMSRPEGVVHLELDIRRDGALIDVKIKRSSGPYLNKAALDAARNAAPFPSFPSDLKRDRITFGLPITFGRGT